MPGASEWIQKVKNYRNEHPELSYKEALVACSTGKSKDRPKKKKKKGSCKEEKKADKEPEMPKHPVIMDGGLIFSLSALIAGAIAAASAAAPSLASAAAVGAAGAAGAAVVKKMTGTGLIDKVKKQIKLTAKSPAIKPHLPALKAIGQKILDDPKPANMKKGIKQMAKVLKPAVKQHVEDFLKKKGMEGKGLTLAGGQFEKVFEQKMKDKLAQ